MWAAVNSKRARKMSGQHVYTMMCGRMTPAQKQMVRQRFTINAKRYTVMLNRYINELGHPGYADFVPSNECPEPKFLTNKDTPNNTDDPVNPEVEMCL